MRVFVIFLAFLTALCAQEKPDVEFKRDYEKLKADILQAQKKELDPPITVEWVMGKFELAEALQIRRMRILNGEYEPSIKEEVQQFKIEPLLEELDALNRGILAQNGVKNIGLVDLAGLIDGIDAVVTNEFEITRDDGVIVARDERFIFQPLQLMRMHFRLSVFSDILESKEFASRVCDEDDICLSRVLALKKKSVTLLDRVNTHIKTREKEGREKK